MKQDDLFAITPDEYEEEATAVESSKKHLAFFSDGLQYAIDVSFVNEIITNYHITLLPKVPGFIKGVMNLRGQITPVVDIRLLMNRPEGVRTSDTCIIIIEVNQVALGILVDGVSRVIDLYPEMISLVPPNVNQELVYGIANVDDTVNLLIDCSKLIKSA